MRYLNILTANLNWNFDNIKLYIYFMEPKILSEKLDIILNKLKNDISKVNGDKL